MATVSPLAGQFRLRDFYIRNTHLFTSEASLRWYIRFRRENGMLGCGAVIELKGRPDSRRPRLIIDEVRFLDWMRKQGMVDHVRERET